MIHQFICIATYCAMITELPTFDLVRAQRSGMSSQAELNLAKQCEEMNSHGKLPELLRILNQNAIELTNMSIAQEPETHRLRINELEAEIRETVTAAKGILRPEWSEVSWPHEVRWDIAIRDFIDVDDQIINSAFEMSGFELSSIKMDGIEREDLYPFIEVSIEKSHIVVNLSKRASSLELCQVQSTLIISGVTQFRFDNKRFSRSTNLKLRPGVSNSKEPHAINPLPDSWFDDLRCQLIRKCEKVNVPRPRIPLPNKPEPFPW